MPISWLSVLFNNYGKLPKHSFSQIFELQETDVEYEEKRANMSLTQAELDKENDYYCRQSSPLHEPDDGTFGDDIDDIVGMF